MSSTVTRRDALRVGGLAIIAGLTGCSSGSEDPPITTSTTSTTPSSTPAGRAAWTYTLGGEVALGPALVDDTLYVGRTDGQFVALDPASGDEVWSTDAGVGFFPGTGGMGAAPTVVDGRVYLVSGARSSLVGRGQEFETVAFDADTGEHHWSQRVDETSILTLLGVSEGHVLVATSDDYLANEGQTLFSLDPASGEVQWTAEVGDPWTWGLGAGGVYVAAMEGMRAVALADGDPRWAKQAEVETDIDLAAGIVVLSLRRRGTPRLLGLDPASGDVRWEGPDWPVTSHAVSTDGIVYTGGERIGAYDAATGEERWSNQEPGTVIAPPVGGRLFARLDGGIHARIPASGILLWRTDASIDGTLAVGESLVAYVAAVDDSAVPPTLVARGATTGETAFAVTLVDIDELTTPIVRGDTVYTSTRTGRVYAFER